MTNKVNFSHYSLIVIWWQPYEHKNFNFIQLSLVSVVNHWTHISYVQLLPPGRLKSLYLLVRSIKLQKLSSGTARMFNSVVLIRKRLLQVYSNCQSFVGFFWTLMCWNQLSSIHIFLFPNKLKSLVRKKSFWGLLFGFSM